MSSRGVCVFVLPISFDRHMPSLMVFVWIIPQFDGICMSFLLIYCMSFLLSQVLHWQLCKVVDKLCIYLTRNHVRIEQNEVADASCLSKVFQQLCKVVRYIHIYTCIYLTTLQSCWKTLCEACRLCVSALLSVACRSVDYMYSRLAYKNKKVLLFLYASLHNRW